MSTTEQTYDLTNCDREPIHILGRVQAHGVLIGCRADTFDVTYASANAAQILGVDAKSLLSLNLADLVTDGGRDETLDRLRAVAAAQGELIPLTLNVDRSEREFNVLAHRSDDVVVIEFEADALLRTEANSYQSLRRITSRLKSSATLEELYQTCVHEVRLLTGFDRVIVYRFDSKWNGHVLAEEKGSAGDSYEGLRFPASDIPAQARALYERNPIRSIAEVAAPESPILAREGEPPLDLSLATLRGVSPIHLEYLRNMEVTASMSISLHKDGRLWGLISCTHLSGPRRMSFATRSVCEVIGEIMSSLLSLRANAGHEFEAERKAIIQARLLDGMARTDDFSTGLLANADLFLELVGASGGVVYTDGDFRVVGRAPNQTQLKKIVTWLSDQKFDGVLATDQLPIDWPGAEEMRDVASGLMAFSLSKAKATYVFWVRPEVVQTVTWGGNPKKNVTGPAKDLHPRKSFEAWKQIVRNHSLPWRRAEIEAARRLRTLIMDIVLHKLEKISLLNRELQRSNGELDSFAYAASHDLKEPLRGIHNYAMILSRALDGRMDQVERNRFATIGRLSQRMEELINSLLNFAQVGRAEMAFATNDLNQIVRAAIDSLQSKIDEQNVEIACSYDLPEVVCDRVQLTEIFTNLIHNAIKYNDDAKKRVEIRAEKGRGGELILSVSDNGIGIEADHYDSVFKIFKRLHAKESYGGGTGTGLTIAAKIVERHGGRIWVEPNGGSGSRFAFSLPSQVNG